MQQVELQHFWLLLKMFIVFSFNGIVVLNKWVVFNFNDSYTKKNNIILLHILCANMSRNIVYCNHEKNQYRVKNKMIFNLT